ncbi:MAG: hypothetical protein C0429_09735 [Sphingopyxis sp.]|nr:hypothetical protein [Sphingopyxis sp.]
MYQKITAQGSFQILSLEKGEVVWQSPVMQNLVLNAYWSLLVEHNTGSATTPLEITTLEIGTGDNVVTAANTALETLTLAGVIPSKVTPAAKSIEMEFFITDAELADGTYREIGLRCGTVLATRALFTTPYVKATGRDTIIRYTVSYDAE